MFLVQIFHIKSKNIYILYIYKFFRFGSHFDSESSFISNNDKLLHFNSLFSNYHKNSRNNYQSVWPSHASVFQSNFQFLPGNFEFENFPKLNFSKTFLNRKDTEDECSKNMSPKDKIKSSLIPPNKELLIKPNYIKNNNDELIKNTTENQNPSKKFFTDYNSGYRCSCSKTQCNRKYCECYNSHRYCFGCNCKNCQNLPPKNSFTNKHPDEIEKEKKNNEVIICTCTKSGCNKKYCECYKSGNKCSELCRCIGCENTDRLKNENNSKKINLNENFILRKMKNVMCLIYILIMILLKKVMN